MKILAKKFICALSAFAVCAVAAHMAVPDIAYAQTEKIIDLDLSDLSEGDRIPDSVGLGNGNTSKFHVTEVDESVSKTKKAVEYISSASDINNNAEIYFHVPEINTTDVLEPTDYYIDVKLMHYPASGSIESGMVVKYVFYNSESTASSDRLFFMGFGSSSVNGEMVVRANAGSKGGYAQGYAEPNEWYRLIYNIHVEPDASKDCVNLKMYKVGDEEPADWQTTLSSSDFSLTGTNFNNTKNIDLVGIKAYKSLMQFADLAIYKYTADDFELYDSVRETVREASEKIKSGEMDYEEATAFADSVQSEVEQLEGIMKNLAQEAWDVVYRGIEDSREGIQKAQEIIAELEAAQITNDNYEELYSKLEEAREAAQKIIFSDKSQPISNALDEQEARLLDFAMKKFSAREYFDYADGYNLKDTIADNDKGWAEGWKIQNGTAQIKDGALNVSDSFGTSRKLLNPVAYMSGRNYYLAWRMKAEEEAGMNLGGIKAGVAEINGKLYPEIDGIKGTKEIKKGNEYNFILVTDTENSQYGMYVYGEGLEISKTYDAAAPITDMSDTDEVCIYSTGGNARFDDISLQMYNSSYGQNAFNKVFEAYDAPYSTGEEIQNKSVLAKEANELVSKMDEGILKAYLSYVCSVTERNVTGAVAESLFDALDKKLTVENAEKVQDIVDGISNEQLKKEYQDRLDVYYKRIKMAAPVIESVGISGALKSGSTVYAVIKSIDETGNGAEPIIEWYIGGRKVRENSVTLTILSDWAGSKIYCEVTPVNKDGVKGTPVTSSRGTIVSSSGGAGSPGGSGGTVSFGKSNTSVNTVVKIPSPSYTQPPGYETEKFNDVKEHWAKTEIYRAYEKGIVNGVSDNSFEPNRQITRAEFVKLIFEALGMSESQESVAYKDVQYNAWYAPYISTVSKAGIVSGADGFFRPDDVISRQETAKIIAMAYKYAKYADVQADEAHYADKEEISQWATEYVNICTELGLMNGVEDNIFSPLSETTRAQAVVIIMRLTDILQY